MQKFNNTRGEKKKRVKERVQKRKKEKNKIKCNNYIKIGS
jgi:hypothetical protein